MAYVQVPKDLTKVKNKVMFNLTKRQLICFGLAALIGIPTYFLTKNLMGTTVAACLMVILMLPFFFFAMYEKDGMPLERILYNIWSAKVQRPGIRIYKTSNFYEKIQEEISDREVTGSGTNVKKKKPQKGGKSKKSGKKSGK